MSLARGVHVVLVVISLLLCWWVWPTISALESKQIQPIASSVSTITGILFGFIMASISVIAAAQNNTLVQNTRLTGYHSRLLDRLHLTMGALLLVCMIFLLVLFLPDKMTFTIGTPPKTYRYSSVVLIIGIFCLLNAFLLFFRSWIRFRSFAENM